MEALCMRLASKPYGDVSREMTRGVTVGLCPAPFEIADHTVCIIAFGQSDTRDDRLEAWASSATTTACSIRNGPPDKPQKPFVNRRVTDLPPPTFSGVSESTCQPPSV